MRKAILFFMFLLLPVTLNYFSPYIIIDGLFKGILAGSFFVWAAMLVTSLFIGRAFCSYVCPYGGLQLVADKVLQKPLKQVKWMTGIRYFLGVVWVSIVLFAFLKNLTAFKLDFFYLTENFVSVDNIIKLVMYYVIVFLLLLLPIFMGKRATCKYLCPMSILNIAGTKTKNILNIPSLRLKAEKDKCTNCRQCNKACPMSLDVNNMVNSDKMDSVECILCGECVKACRFSCIERVYGKRDTLDRASTEYMSLK